ncbi:D-2-hydroxyacid dehydrogenase [Paralcaligenes sp. KSB-10]|uniref:NAD(P)-dependent oxidoreductase n=1 Tax=Paralcaligenes sp. KSB-10 TaxID=2901142 RepID=UPI001E4AFC7B|nr:NAD(P)-dependent oxidoreductase [Paralcaligenes sp. KSB-10]UHL66059.1 D-2-hydroxyacid dehydrogenase [Paralcaligenes sp. KSB-10]
MVQKKIHLLASSEAIELINAKDPGFLSRHIDSIVLYSPGELPDARQSDKVNVALLSRDITGASTKHRVLPPLAAFSSLLLSARSLQWLHTHSAGTDRPIYQDLKAQDVAITTSTGANAAIVAQSALAAVLALNRKFKLLQAAQAARAWRPLMGEYLPKDLAGQSAVVVGWGQIGRKIAAYLQLLDIEVTAVRRNPSTAENQGGFNAVKMISYSEFKKNTVQHDWLILACPLTETTFKIISRQFISGLSDRTHIINVSRGDVIDEPALVEALKGNKLAGAYLDVFAHEPLGRDSELWDAPNTIVSPHSAGHASGNYGRAIDIFMKNIPLWLEGKPLINVAF